MFVLRGDMSLMSGLLGLLPGGEASHAGHVSARLTKKECALSLIYF